MKKFDEKTKSKLKHYVYALKEPSKKIPFYIGKGTNNRVFDHINCKIDDIDENHSPKLEKIKAITSQGEKIEHIIIRHGLSEREALKIEATMIDFLDYFEQGVINQNSGHHSNEYGIMTADEIIRLYNATPLESIRQDCLIININSTYRRGNDSDAIYNSTKSAWAIAKNKILDKNGNILRKYVLSEYHQLIVEVFEVENWYQEQPYTTPKGKTKQRWAFEGKVAPTDIRDLYINKSIYKKRGDAQVIKYFINKREP